MGFINQLITGGHHPVSLWKMMDFVSWDDDMTPKFMESHKIPWFQTSNQYIKSPFSMGKSPFSNQQPVNFAIQVITGDITPLTG